MREIKFRAWNAPLKKMEYDSLNAIGFDGRVYYGNADITGFFENIMQYTGLKDKNGREIWEGDIVLYDRNIAPSIDSRKYVVEWYDGQFVLDNRSQTIDDFTSDLNLIEVIGNIYENLELLEEIK
ncbi:YopX family protein [Bacillus sp. FSL M8-0168]|uniref:YopX family protein n=1 Tax=Bacillus sp. FSL M8-0168 TaxID=2921614 RepID=UPI0030FDEE84